MKKHFIIFSTMATFITTLIGSPPILVISNLGSSQIQVITTNISSFGTGVITIETSTNLVSWTPAVTNHPYAGFLGIYTNVFQATNSTMFYRIKP